MVQASATAQPGRRWSHHLRGHLLQFEPPARPSEPSIAGVQLLVTAATLEVLRFFALRWLSPGVPLWMLTPMLVGVAVLSLWATAGVPLSQLGLQSWNRWSATEKSYFLQVMTVATAFAVIILAAPEGRSGGQEGSRLNLWTVFIPYLFFGFYQELVYRGMVQVALVRRWGAPAGILAANLLYTFGPLHANYLAARPSVAVPMFASIFMIGLFFGTLYRRSGNLWIVGSFHAIGNAILVWRLGDVA